MNFFDLGLSRFRAMEASSASERASAMNAEKQRKEDMLMVRRNFKEPQVERDRIPDWLELLQKKKSQNCQSVSSTLAGAKWVCMLERQQALLSRTTAAGDDKSSPEFMSAWLRQLNGELHDELSCPST